MLKAKLGATEKPTHVGVTNTDLLGKYLSGMTAFDR